MTMENVPRGLAKVDKVKSIARRTACRISLDHLLVDKTRRDL